MLILSTALNCTYLRMYIYKILYWNSSVLWRNFGVWSMSKSVSCTFTREQFVLLISPDLWANYATQASECFAIFIWKLRMVACLCCINPLQKKKIKNRTFGTWVPLNKEVFYENLLSCGKVLHLISFCYTVHKIFSNEAFISNLVLSTFSFFYSGLSNWLAC